MRLSWDYDPETGTGGLLNGDVLYPLVEWGYSYGPTGPSNAENRSLSLNSTGNSFDNIASPLYLQQLKPAPRLKAVWDAIFNRSGYTYESDFLNSLDFKNIYLLTENEALPYLRADNDFQVFYKELLSTSAAGATVDLEVNSVAADPGANVVGNTYIVPVTGNYAINFSGLLRGFIPTGSTQTWTFSLWNDTTEAVIGSTVQMITGSDCTADSHTVQFGPLYGGATYSLTGGDVIKMQARLDIDYDPLVCIGPPDYEPENKSSKLELNSTLFITPGGSGAPDFVQMRSYMPCEKKQVEFIKAIADRFKLVFEPSKETPNHFIIEPWKDWILDGNVKDWSRKLDLSKDFVIKPAFYTQQRNIEFKDKEDSDIVNYAYQQSNNTTFGDIKLDSGIELITGEKKVESLFAATPLDIIDGSPSGSTAGDNPWLIAHLGKLTPGSGEEDFNKIEPIIPQMRLVYYNGKRDTPTWYLQATTNPSTVTAGATQTTAPQISSFSEWDLSIAGGPGGTNQSSTTKDLHWGGALGNNDPNTQVSTDPVYDTSVYEVDTAVDNTNFNVYWKLWYDNFLNTSVGAKYSRTATAYFKLDINDVRDLRFNDRIWVKDSYWYVTKISDFVVGQASLCKVELLKLYTNNGRYRNFTLGASAGLSPFPSFGWKLNNLSGAGITYSYKDCNADIFYSGLTLSAGASAIFCSCAEPIFPSGTSMSKGGFCGTASDTYAYRIFNNGNTNKQILYTDASGTLGLTSIGYWNQGGTSGIYYKWLLAKNDSLSAVGPGSTAGLTFYRGASGATNACHLWQITGDTLFNIGPAEFTPCAGGGATGSMLLEPNETFLYVGQSTPLNSSADPLNLIDWGECAGCETYRIDSNIAGAFEFSYLDCFGAWRSFAPGPAAVTYFNAVGYICSSDPSFVDFFPPGVTATLQPGHACLNGGFRTYFLLNTGLTSNTVQYPIGLTGASNHVLAAGATFQYCGRSSPLTFSGSPTTMSLLVGNACIS